ncbi:MULTISPECIES: VOC family protein [Ruegeria]
MQKVNGIGGVFLRARDPDALSAWYEKHLGVNHYDPLPW